MGALAWQLLSVVWPRLPAQLCPSCFKVTCHQTSVCLFRGGHVSAFQRSQRLLGKCLHGHLFLSGSTKDVVSARFMSKIQNSRPFPQLNGSSWPFPWTLLDFCSKYLQVFASLATKNFQLAWVVSTTSFWMSNMFHGKGYQSYLLGLPSNWSLPTQLSLLHIGWPALRKKTLRRRLDLNWSLRSGFAEPSASHCAFG